MDATKKKESTLKKLLNSDLKSLTKKNDGTESASVTKVKKSKIKEVKKKIPKRVLSFDIGSNSIKIVAARLDKKKILVEKLLDIPTPKDTVEDGKLRDTKVLSDIIEYQLKENKINIKDAIFTTDSTSIINRELIIPKVEEDEIPVVIRFEIQQYLPIDLSDYILDYTVMDIIDNVADGTQKYKVNVIAYPERNARSYYDLFGEESEIKPYALDIAHNSLKKLVQMNTKITDVDNNDDETIALIDMGAENIKINIYKNKELDFTRIIREGGNDIDKILSERMNISEKIVESTKIQNSNLEYIREDDKFNETVTEIINDWIDSIGRVFHFYRNKEAGNKINNVFIYGGTSNIPGLPRKIMERLAIPTQKVISFDNVELPKGHLAKEPIEKYVNAIGAVIRY